MDWYIKTIIGLLLAVNFMILFIFIRTNLILKKFIFRTNEIRVYKSYYQILNRWLKYRIASFKISQYFKDENVSTIAIYGQGELGMRLYEELNGSDIEVKYFITNSISKANKTLVPVITIENLHKQEEVDWIVITPVYDYLLIKNQIRHYNKAKKIISLEEIIK